VKNVNKLLCALVFVIAILQSVECAGPVFAIIPEIYGAIPYSSGGDTILNVTVYHYPEIGAHYVNLVQVNVTGSVYNFTIGVQPLTPENTFTVSCNLGQISGIPTATVRAHCTYNGNGLWYGPVLIPEFSHLTFLLISLLVVSLAVVAFRKTKVKV